MKKDKMDCLNIEGIHYESGKPVRIEIVDGLIGSIHEIPVSKDENVNLFVAPGLIDNQINGYAGVDFSGDNLIAADVIAAVHSIWKEGITTFLPTLLTNSHEKLIKNLKILDEIIRKDDGLRKSIPGSPSSRWPAPCRSRPDRQRRQPRRWRTRAPRCR